MLTLARMLALLASAAGLLTAATPPRLTHFDAFEWRFIGPFRGGRVLAVTGVPGDDRTFYFGAVGGGIWKTTDAGTVWTPVFDSQPAASIGAIEVAPSNPNVIYVGTGEADMRSDITAGNGMYKSVDGGRTWSHIGLRDSQQIGRILVDPRNPNLVYVAALGHAYAANAERGVYRSSDGGLNWTKVLNKGPEIGAIDLAFESDNSRVIYAAMWNSRRPPWSQYGPIEGPGSGLYRSTDGGDNWTQLAGNGLPQGDWRRVGIATARSTRGRRVYALIDAKDGGGLYRSDDSGRTWSRVGADPRITNRAWYFGSITVDPKNPDIVYVPNISVYRSTDGGKNFDVLKGAPGGDDYHTLWIDPSQPDRMILGSDQGTNISVDGAKTWTPWYNQPTAQMYHVITDNQFPYWVYGSQQDSGTVALPSRTDHGMITEYDRRNVGGAESGYIAPDPKDPDVVYVGNMAAALARFNKRTSQSQNITPWPLPGFSMDISQRKYRGPWTAPLVFSPIEPRALYLGSQVLLKTLDGGLSWSEISPDLTAADSRNPQPTNHGVIYSISPSPLNAAVIWVGSDTGLIHLTRSGGKQWSNVTPKEVTDWSKVTHLEASHFDPAVAYAAVDRHRLDDFRPHIFRTRDFGKSWTEICNGIGEAAFVNAVREDPVRKGLLYAATETGVYISFDDGEHWEPLQLNLPTASVRDLVVHGNDLVIATHGRGFWILDDIEPLREERPGDAFHLYKPATAVRMLNDSFQGTPFPPEVPRAKNPPDGAIIDCYLPANVQGEITLEIADTKNQVVRRYSTSDATRERRGIPVVADIWIVPPPRLTAKPGLNRFVWDIRYATPQVIESRRGGGEDGRAAGPLALPGTYQVRVTAMGQTLSQPLKVTLDPRSPASPADLAAQFDLATKASRQMQRAADLAAHEQDAEKVRKLSAVNRDLGAVLSVANSADRRPPAQAYALYQQLVRDLDALASAMGQ